MKYQYQSIGKERAIQLGESEWWKDKDVKDIAAFQLLTDELCMPFVEFHKAVEATLGRPVWTHEFALNREGLLDELFGDRQPPTINEIINLIPAEKRFIFVHEL